MTHEEAQRYAREYFHPGESAFAKCVGAILASHAPSGHLNLELADRDRIIKGLIADNERLVSESYIAGMGDGAKLARKASEAAAQPTVCGCCGKQATSSMGPCSNTADGLHSWEFEIEHNDH